MNNNVICIISIFFLLGCKTEYVLKKNEIKIAFMADIHFSDVYPNIKDNSLNSLPSIEENNPVLIRTMKSQVHSTRLFNENYFALIAALDDAVNRGIKIIALPGDFSDDGQALHIKGLNTILNTYREKYGISFFMINGNHDPTHPFGNEGNKVDFLEKNGKAQRAISSKEAHTSDLQKENNILIIEDLNEWGYEEIVNELSDHGFSPNKSYKYWATPFSNYNYKNYNYRKASKASKINQRTFYTDENATILPDVSYLVEPVEGLWLLALDANVFIPNENSTSFTNSGVGYNEVLKHKRYLIDWTQKIVEDANRFKKTLIAFSHYPMIEFNDGASDDMKTLFGMNTFQAHRIPDELVGETFADIGLKVHVGGHMHLNDTGVIISEKGNTLVNIQTPSLGSYIPAYKIININNHNLLEVQTAVLDTVFAFESFFNLYKKEYYFLEANKENNLWDKDILLSKNYLEYTEWHLKELIRLRFLPSDWSFSFAKELQKATGKELLSRSKVTPTQDELKKLIQDTGFKIEDFEKWTGNDMIYDFYRLKLADELAHDYIGEKRLQQYNLVCEQLKSCGIQDFELWGNIFQKNLHGKPSRHFQIDLNSGFIQKLED